LVGGLLCVQCAVRACSMHMRIVRGVWCIICGVAVSRGQQYNTSRKPTYIIHNNQHVTGHKHGTVVPAPLHCDHSSARTHTTTDPPGHTDPPPVSSQL
jgi:hypothetical protein